LSRKDVKGRELAILARRAEWLGVLTGIPFWESTSLNDWPVLMIFFVPFAITGSTLPCLVRVVKR
jgi:hypothetical protein